MNFPYPLFVCIALGLAACASSGKKSVELQKDSASTVVELNHSGIQKTGSVFSVDSLGVNSEVRHVALFDSASLPTLAALDFAAYYENPVREAGHDEMPENYKGLLAEAELAKYPFPMLDSISGEEPAKLKGISQMEWIAWEPFVKRLHAEGAGDTLAKELRLLEGVKWGETDVHSDFQKVEKLLYVNNGNSGEWWVNVKPRKWTGHVPFWGRLTLRPSEKESAVWRNYTSKKLSLEESLDWVRSLAAYWYPSLNTDLELFEPGTEWNKNYPFAVMRGNPMGTPMWVAFDVPAFKKKTAEKETVSPNASVSRSLDTSSAWRLSVLESLNGACPETKETETFKVSLAKVLDSIPKEQNAWNAGGVLFFRRDANSLLAKDFLAQDSMHNPLPRMQELKAFFDSLGIQFLVVPVPVKEAAYPGVIVKGIPDSLCVDVAGREFIRKMLEAGIDVLDVYPVLSNSAASFEPLYQRYDTHWSYAGLLGVATLLAEKVMSYSWYKDAGARPGFLEIRDTVITRDGDLVEQLPQAEREKYPADTLDVKKVYLNGKPYVGKNNSPILLMGDSFTGVFESVDGHSGGPGALLAFATGLDVQVMTSWGGGPGVRHRMLKDKKALSAKRLVIYMMTMRDFYQAPMEWDSLRNKTEP